MCDITCQIYFNNQDDLLCLSRVRLIIEDAPEPLVWQNFVPSLMIVRVEVKDPP